MRSGVALPASLSRTRGWQTATGACHHIALRQMTVAHEALVADAALQIDMLAEKVCDLGLDRLGKQRTRPVAQDVGERIVEGFWLF